MAIEEREGRGRCFFADRDFTTGDVIIDESSYAFVLSDSMFSLGVCSYCGLVDPSSAPFATCDEDWARYCSQICMEKDRLSGHMVQMKACQDLIGKGVEGSLDSMRLVLKIAGKFSVENDMEKIASSDDQHEKLTPKQRKKLRYKLNKQVKKQLEGKNSIESASEEDQGKTEPIDNLNAASLNIDFKNPNKRTIMTLDQGGRDSSIDNQGKFMVRAIATLLSEGGLVSSEEALFLLFAIQCNAHRVVDMSCGKMIGVGLFPLVSMLNHACDSNCEHEFVLEKGEKPRLLVKAVRDIAKGEECCYSYVPPHLPLAQRALLLREGYGIDIPGEAGEEGSP